MSTIIDKTLFVADIHLAKGVYDDIDTFISRYEPEVLDYLLGPALYQLFDNAQDEEPYKFLIDGKEYSVIKAGETITVKFPGVKKLIAYYVYCEYMRKQITSTQSVGEIKSKSENSRNANIFGKLFSAAVRFEKLYGYSSQDILEPSAYNFLYEHSDLFPHWNFTDLRGNLNSHDL
jgi:hypothetical protein